jgi:hypothetical protein
MLSLQDILTENNTAADLARKATKLKPSALVTVATITGAPSAQHFLESLDNQSKDSLSRLRSSLINMGLA